MSESNAFFKRLVVEKGVTAKVGEDYIRSNFTLEVDLSVIEQLDKTIDETRKRVVAMMDKWIDEEKGAASIQKEVAEIPDIDPAEIADLGWKNFQKELCEPDEVGWIMQNTKGAEKLSEAIVKGGGELQIGEFIYNFSGDKKQFINRRHPKKESAKK